ncbi:hypothetical protein ACUZXZ_16265 [Pseudomonas juntendi]|uniref:hypothetical protein n=1 Tax=Pseudomonas juntendi TaxID=2666183 RepID=UPI001F2BE48C|nr:hypothetical protein [Pseudomonas juntendi]MCO7055119.1 hypothetical protein [Pseudomonas juntendi]UJM10791.1 hypothetical protein L1P09_15750 [Pseudomonas juntendi]
MDTNKMREQFEAAFVAQYGFGRMTAASNPDANAIYCAAEWAWKASREAVAVELPSFEGYKDHIVRELQAAFSGAIERQGLKVVA